MINTEVPQGEYDINADDMRTFLADLSTDLVSLTEEQDITFAGVVFLDAKNVALDSTLGGFAVTLDIPADVNVYKIIEMTVDAGDVTLSLSNVVGGSASTTCTWNDVGDILVLVSSRSKWVVVKELGVVLT